MANASLSPASFLTYDVSWYRGCRFIGSTSFRASGPLMALLGAVGGREFSSMTLASDGVLSCSDKTTGVDYVVMIHSEFHQDLKP